MRTILTLMLASLALLACDGEATLDTSKADGFGEDAEVFVPPEDFEAPSPVEAVETTVAPESIRAGETFAVDCTVFNADGTEAIFAEAPREQLLLAAADSFSENDDGERIGVRAGEASIACTIPSLSLVDQSPSTLRIEPGDPYSIITYVDADTITAGETVNAACDVFDRYGNLIPDATPELIVEPVSEGVSVEGYAATLTTAGLHTLSCSVPGTQVEIGQDVDVRPGAPASIVVSRSPDQAVYGLGQVVTFNVTVTDAYGNVIPNADPFVRSSPRAQPFGDDRYRFNAEGTFEITATIEGGDGETLTATTEVIVNGSGPAIDCDSPADASFVDMTPGGRVTFEGRVDDANGVARVSVNGSDLPIEPDGRFAVGIDTRFGMNFIDITTEDTFGSENSRTCTFLVSRDWVRQGRYFDDAIALRLAQSGFDDGNRNDGLDSLNDILYTALNSSGPRDTLHATLSRNGGVLKDSCDQRACPCFGGCCFCAHHSKVTYRDLRLNGPHSTELDLVSGGLRAKATIRDINLQIRIDSTLYDGTGWVRFDAASADITFDVGLSNRRPDVTIRRINSVDISNVDLDFPGFGGVIIDIVQFLFQGPIRNLVRNTLRDYVRDNFNAILDDVLSNLDVSALGQSFNVPQLDGSGTVPISFSIRFSSLPVSNERALFGIGPRFNSSIVHGGPSLGAPVPSGSVRHDPSTSRSIAASIHVGVLNQALHALWRGGLFDATIDGAALSGSFPEGTRARIRTNLPPVAELIGTDEVRLGLGAMRLDLTYPGFFDTPLSVTLGATATTGVSLSRSGEDLVFRDVVINDFYFSTSQVSLDNQSRSLIEDFLRSLIQDVVDSALNDALPALPIPAFTLPGSLSSFGLPTGATLGLLSPGLTQTPRHFVLTGNFGVQ